LAKQTTTAHAQRLRDYGREVVQERDALVEAAQGAVSELSAFGVGLILGGGLPLGIVGFTARAAAGMAARQMVEGMLPGAIGSARPKSRAASREPREE
jgi:hypothetical protein